MYRLFEVERSTGRDECTNWHRIVAAHRVVDLDSARVPADFVIDVGIDGGSSAKLVVDGEYVGEADESPLRFGVSLAPGAHRVRVRAVVGDEEVSADARSTVVGGIDETGSA